MVCNISANHTMQWALIGMSIPVFLLGLIFNAMTLWAFCWKIRKWTETIIYVTNLAVSDSVLLLSLPFKMYSYKPPRKLDSGLCALGELLYFVNMYVSIYITVCISMDRYVAVKHPLKAKRLRSPMKAAIACVAIWTFVCLIGIILQIKFTVENEKTEFCFLKKNEKPTSIWIIIAIELIGFIIPSCILSFCSFQIIMTLCKKSKGSQGNLAFSRSIIIVASNLIIFFICFMPFHVGLLIQFLLETLWNNCEMLKNVRNFISVSTCMASMNCCLDAIIYYFASSEVAQVFNFLRQLSFTQITGISNFADFKQKVIGP
ncbi:G-protein coupled receptor 35-like [Carcharodon carcharias]|uniref:G-protein coupled receptor 35-like n=1 Tax=Carcharodon carcharias TaxID=13397 RepID=UPI001B7E1CC5|nr:G-protein coupled receptor 35-like [Carcharodon carcharias]